MPMVELIRRSRKAASIPSSRYEAIQAQKGIDGLSYGVQSAMSALAVRGFHLEGEAEKGRKDKALRHWKVNKAKC